MDEWNTLPELRPNWVRKLFCIFYFPLVTIGIFWWLVPIFMIVERMSLKKALHDLWWYFYVSCWVGVNICDEYDIELYKKYGINYFK